MRIDISIIILYNDANVSLQATTVSAELISTRSPPATLDCIFHTVVITVNCSERTGASMLTVGHATDV